MVLAIAVVVVVAIAGGVGVFLAGQKTTSTTSASASSSSSQTLTTQLTTSSTSSSTSTSHGTIVVLPPNSNFTVDSQVCKYFNFTDNSFYANFTGSFTANPEVAMYLLNVSSWSLAHFVGSSITEWTYASTGSGNQFLANHLMVSAYSFNVSIPAAPYYLGFCNWDNVPTQVMTNATGISISW